MADRNPMTLACSKNSLNSSLRRAREDEKEWEEFRAAFQCLPSRHNRICHHHIFHPPAQSQSHLSRLTFIYVLSSSEYFLHFPASLSKESGGELPRERRTGIKSSREGGGAGVGRCVFAQDKTADQPGGAGCRTVDQT